MMRKRFAVFGVLALVLVLLMPSRAFAWDFLSDGQMWAGDVGSSHCATVHAGEIYDAATYAVGSDPNKISASVRVKLSDPNYGGRFYEYAQTFHKMESWDDYPEWLPAYVGVAQLVSNGLIGDFNIYNSEASSTLYNGAVLDFQRVLAGEDLGGPPDSVPAGRYYKIPITSDYGASLPSQYVGKYAYFSVDLLASLNSLLSSSYPGFSVYYCFRYDGNVNRSYFFPLGSLGVSVSNAYRYSFNKLIQFRVPDVVEVAGDIYLFSSGDVSVGYENLNSITITSKYVPVYMLTNNFNYPVVYVGSPGGDWPEPTTPVTPDPPEQPTPTAPTVTPDNDPSEPVVTWPTSPTVVLPTQPTPSTTPSGLDYTGLLTLINDNLISIDDYVQAFNSSFNSFRADFVTAVDSVVDSIRNIYNYLGHLNDILEVHCKHIRDQIEDSVYNLELYLKGLFEWLPRQLDYDAEFNYDDTYVTNLLYRILNKIPGGSAGTPVTYQPNPQADEPGFFDWLLDLWHRFLIDLVSVLPDELGGLVDAFSQLTHYFPFSIPWDLAALLALFEHEPVTPVFDVPWGFGGDEGEIQMVRVDLHCWDGVMEMVRPVFVAGFCIQLALITKELLENFDIHRGGV